MSETLPQPPDATPLRESKRPRHTPELGYARGDETRRRILDAGIRLFGERGYEGASTRDIAKLAGVNAPALQYYFDNKDGLYRACAEHIADNVWRHFGPVMAHAEAMLADPAADVEALIDAFARILDASADHLLVSYDIKSRQLFVAQEQAGSGPGVLMELMEQTVRPRMIAACSQIVARVSGRPADDPLTLIRIMSLHGQLKAFQTMPSSTMNLLGWDRLTAERVDFLKRTVREQTRVLMRCWRDERRVERGDAAG